MKNKRKAYNDFYGAKIIVHPFHDGIFDSNDCDVLLGKEMLATFRGGRSKVRAEKYAADLKRVLKGHVIISQDNSDVQTSEDE